MGDLSINITIKHRSINITIKPDDKGFQIVVLDSKIAMTIWQESTKS